MRFFYFWIMRKPIFFIFLFLPFFFIAQNQELAKSFFEDGAYEKASLEYAKLIKKQPYRIDFVQKQAKCLQELKQFDKANKLLQKAMNSKYKRPQLWVDLGYNYTLQKDSVNAQKAYQKAIAAIQNNPNAAYSIGRAFENHNLLQEAKQVYTTAMQLSSKTNVHLQLAYVYGQLYEVQNMFNSYLNLMAKNKKIIPRVQQLISPFITSDAKNENNIKLKRSLFKKLQVQPNTLWNKQLSWLFAQQKQYDKAFVQEKAIYKRERETLQRLFNLALTAKDNHDFDTATEILNFIKIQKLERTTQIKVEELLLQLVQKTTPKKEYHTLTSRYKVVLDTFGINANTISIQLDYVDVLAFKIHKIPEALTFLKTNKNQRLNRFSKARYVMKYADVLVADGQFNNALINYSKIQKSLKNNVLSQEARFKVAKTSYYKGDFDWALQQLKVLKASTSQLIANDALDLHLLINEHVKEDSLHIALKKYAKADLLAFQNKTDESITVLADILEMHKGDKIEDDVLFLQAKLLEAQGNDKAAIKNYKFIIKNLKESIFTDDAHYHLGALYLKLGDKNAAKKEYEIILFKYPDSIYFVTAQKMYRKLRGDDIQS